MIYSHDQDDITFLASGIAIKILYMPLLLAGGGDPKYTENQPYSFPNTLDLEV